MVSIGIIIICPLFWRIVYILTLIEHQSFCLGTVLVKGSFQIEVLTLILLITENRLWHAGGPVQFHIESVTNIDKVSYFIYTLLCVRPHDQSGSLF